MQIPQRTKGKAHQERSNQVALQNGASDTETIATFAHQEEEARHDLCPGLSSFLTRAYFAMTVGDFFFRKAGAKLKVEI